MKNTTGWRNGTARTGDLSAAYGGGTSGASSDSSDRGCGASAPRWSGLASNLSRVTSRMPPPSRAPVPAFRPSSQPHPRRSRVRTGDSIETVDQQGQLALVEAARQAGVDRFVFVSFRENPGIQFPLTVAKRAVERALKSSGMAYTILQASYFMEVWLTPALGFDAANGKVRLYGDGSRPISWISYRDVARAAAAAVTEGTARNMVVELGGPQALSPREVVRMFEAAGAGEIATESVPEAALEAQMNAATDSLQKSFAGLMLQCAAGDAIDTTTSSRLFPFQMTSVRDFITAQLAAARG